MANDSTQQGKTAGVRLGKYPVAQSFALLVLAALLGLALLRHFTGTISIQTG